MVLHIGDYVALAAWASNFFIGANKERVGCTHYCGEYIFIQ